jgi:hypothetical protein
MRLNQSLPVNIDEYIASFQPDIQAILTKIRSTIRNAAPAAEEVISYRMPAFKLNGILVYFAAFKKHIGLYPPVRGERKAAEGHRALRRGEGQLAISTRSADSVRSHREDRETESEAKLDTVIQDKTRGREQPVIPLQTGRLPATDSQTSAHFHPGLSQRNRASHTVRPSAQGQSPPRAP